MRGGSRVTIEPHRHEGRTWVMEVIKSYQSHCGQCSGVFIARGREDSLVTRNMVVGESVYGEKRITVETEVSVKMGQ